MFIYNLAIQCLKLLFFVGRFVNTKLKLGYEGRKNWRQKLALFREKNQGKLLWFHCASLGEFEMIRPVLDELKANELEEVIVFISFFSPSGYELRKNYKDVHGVAYMPFDTPKNAHDFIHILKPSIAVFVKYEFWLNHLATLKQFGSKMILVNGVFRKDQIFFKWYGGDFREALAKFDYLFLQNKHSEKLLEFMKIGRPKNALKSKITITGDLRYDRVVTISKNAVSFPQLDSFLKDAFVIVAGSTWPVEERIIDFVLQNTEKPIKCILAPHDVSETHLQKIEKLLERFKIMRFSHLTSVDNPQIVLVDSVGHLSSLYQYANIALVGGGFTGALHNIIEPAVFGIPVFFGYKYSKFPEAEYFKTKKIGISIHNGFNFNEHVKDLLANPKKLEDLKLRTPHVFKPHLGGSHQVFYRIKGILNHY
jgi:3-deoxy-D-manno-octulosonic-acid transferase